MGWFWAGASSVRKPSAASYTWRHRYFKGNGGGVANWTVRPDIFPPGGDGALASFTKAGWPVIGHNRYWSSDTPYARQNGGDFEFSDNAPAMVVQGL